MSEQASEPPSAPPWTVRVIVVCGSRVVLEGTTGEQAGQQLSPAEQTVQQLLIDLQQQFLKDCPSFDILFVQPDVASIDEKEPEPWKTLLKKTSALLYNICDDTTPSSVDDERRTKYYFCGLGVMGGLILKHFLLQTDPQSFFPNVQVEMNTIGVGFLGSIHNEKADDFGPAMRSALACEEDIKTSSWLKITKDNIKDHYLLPLFSEYRQKIESMATLSFYENKSMTIRGKELGQKNIYKSKTVKVITKDLASSLIAVEPIGVNMDHRQLATSLPFEDEVLPELSFHIAHCFSRCVPSAIQIRKHPVPVASSRPATIHTDTTHQSSTKILDGTRYVAQRSKSFATEFLEQHRPRKPFTLPRPVPPLPTIKDPPRSPTPTSGTEVPLSTPATAVPVFDPEYLSPEPPNPQTPPPLPARRPSTHRLRELRLPCYYLNPFQLKEPDRVFCGRRQLLSRLGEDFLSDYRANQGLRAMNWYGLGGIGKTQTILTFICENLEFYDVVLWVLADARTKAEQSFVGFALQLGLVHEPILNRSQVPHMVVDWLQKHEKPWLIIYDNAGADLDIFKKGSMFPSGGDNGAVMVVSQKNLHADLHIKEDEVKGLDIDEAVQLLRELMGNKLFVEEDAKRVIKRIGCMPIGLQTAADFVRKMDITLAEYLSAYNNEKFIELSKARDLGAGDIYAQSLMTAWSLPLKKLKEQPDQAPIQLLEVMAFLDPDAINESDLRDGVSAAGMLRTRLAPTRKLDDEKNYIILARGELRSWSLIGRNEQLGQLWLHRLLSTRVRLALRPKEYWTIFVRAYKIIRACWPPIPELWMRHQNQNWPKRAKLLNHVECFSTLLAEKLDSSSMVRDIVNAERAEVHALLEFLVGDVSQYVYETGHYKTCLKLLEEITELRRVANHRDSLITAQIQFQRGSLAAVTNKLELAMVEFEGFYRTVTQIVSSRGEDAAGDLLPQSIACLGYGCAGLARYDEAIAYFKQALTEPDRISPTYRYNMSTCLRLKGSVEEAMKLAREVIKEMEARYGPQDTTSMHAARAYFALACAQAETSDKEEALATMRIAKRLMKTVLGSHHRTADVAWHLGYLLDSLGLKQEALTELDQAATIFRATTYFKPELGRTLFTSARVHGLESSKGVPMLQEATELIREVKAELDFTPTSEEDFTCLINFWSK